MGLLRTLKFPYQKLLIKDSCAKIHEVYRPLIPVHIIVGKNSLLSYGLIDSGADISLFDAAFCEKLGLILHKGKKQTLQGIGHGRITFFIHEIQIKIGTYQVRTHVGFSKEISHIPFGLLGQKGFFEKFRVAFNYPKKWIEVIQS